MEPRELWFEKAYNEGYNASLAGEDEDRNPYEYQTDEYWDWRDGWNDAEDGSDD